MATAEEKISGALERELDKVEKDCIRPLQVSRSWSHQHHYHNCHGFGEDVFWDMHDILEMCIHITVGNGE